MTDTEEEFVPSFFANPSQPFTARYGKPLIPAKRHPIAYASLLPKREKAIQSLSVENLTVVFDKMETVLGEEEATEEETIEMFKIILQPTDTMRKNAKLLEHLGDNKSLYFRSERARLSFELLKCMERLDRTNVEVYTAMTHMENGFRQITKFFHANPSHDRIYKICPTCKKSVWDKTSCHKCQELSVLYKEFCRSKYYYDEYQSEQLELSQLVEDTLRLEPKNATKPPRDRDVFHLVNTTYMKCCRCVRRVGRKDALCHGFTNGNLNKGEASMYFCKECVYSIMWPKAETSSADSSKSKSKNNVSNNTKKPKAATSGKKRRKQKKQQKQQKAAQKEKTSNEKSNEPIIKMLVIDFDTLEQVFWKVGKMIGLDEVNTEEQYEAFTKKNGM